MTAQSTEVIVVGGGMVGLSAALFLQQLEIPFVLVEQRAQDSVFPRSRGVHVRTMELFRQLGLQQTVEAAAASAWKQGGFGGARRGTTMLDASPLALRQGRQPPSADASPCAFCACPQSLLEPALREPLEARGGDVRFGCELVAVDAHDAGVAATVRDRRGHDATISASYVLAADGGRSFVRHHLGIAAETTPADRHYLNIFFRADLAAHVRDRTFSQCEVANARVRGLFLSKNNTSEWSFHLEYDPAVTAPESGSREALVELVQAAIGSPDVAIEIIGTAPWSTAVRIAERYRVGRVFLAGDAAHVMPPWGGFNGNTGIADVHNLAWKLAAVIRGQAAPALLDSYERERRPVAVRNGRQARLRTDFDARFELETAANREAFRNLEDTGALLTRYSYAAPGESVDHLRAQTGTRFPHAWLDLEGARRSTLDLFGASHVVIAGPSASAAWSGGEPGARRLVVGRDLELVDADTSWASLTGLPDHGAVLVRPDGFVGARFDGSEPVGAANPT